MYRKAFKLFVGCMGISLLTLSYSLSAAQLGELPKPLQEKDFTERAKFWMRKLQLASNSQDYEYCRKNMVALGPRAVPTITKIILSDTSKAPWLHWNTALALGKLGDDRALPYLLKKLAPVSAKELKSRPEWTYSRSFAALALGKIKDPAKTAIAPLRKILTDPSESTFLRRAVLLALGKLEDKAGVGEIGKILLDPEGPSTLRSAAALSLGMIRGEPSINVFIDYLGLDPEEHDALTDRMVVQAMGMLKKDETAQVLRTLLASRDESLRGTTAIVLAHLNDRAAVPLIEMVMEDRYAPGFTRCNAALALGSLGKREKGGAYIRSVLQTVLTNPKQYSSGTLAYAAVALGQFRSDDTLKLLRLVLLKKTVSPVVKLNAVNALGHIKDPRMVDFLLSVLGSMRGTDKQYIRGEVIRALLSHPTQESIRRALLRSLKDHSTYVKQKAAIALARYPGSDTEMMLMGMLDERDYQLRGQVALSLGVLKSQRAVSQLRKVLTTDESDWVRLCARKALENIIKYGQHPTWQTSGLQAMIDQRIKVVGATIKEEMDRLYTVAYQRVLELDKPYRANKKVW